MVDRLLVVCLSREISQWTARPSGTAREVYGDVHLHACGLWYWREHRQRLLLIVVLTDASADAATAAGAAAAVVAAAMICRMIWVELCGWRGWLLQHLLRL